MAKLIISEQPEFSIEMEAMESTTPAHYEQWNSRYKQLLSNEQYLKNCLMNYVQNNKVVTCSAIGMTQNDDNGNNFILLCEKISKSEMVIVDGMYHINTATPYTIDNNVTFISADANCGFDVSGTGYLFDVGEHCKKIELLNLIFNNSSSACSVLFRKENYDKTRMNVVKMEGCSTNGNISPFRFSQSVYINPEETDIGIDLICIANNRFMNNNCTCFIFNDVSHTKLEVFGNTVRNMGNSFFMSGTMNDSPYIKEIGKSMKQAIIYDNDVYNDDTCFLVSPDKTYYVFVLIEGDKVHYYGNRVEGLKSMSYVALYDAYLSCDDVIYERNLWKNNVVFDESCPSNCLMKSKGNISGKGKRRYSFNTFITEKSYYEKFEALEKGYVTLLSNISPNDYELEGNYINVYRIAGFESSSKMANTIMRKNVIKVEEWKGGNLLAGTTGSEITLEENYIEIGNGSIAGLTTGELVAKKFDCSRNTFKGVKSILGNGNAEELLFNDNMIYDDNDRNCTISSYGEYQKVTAHGNQAEKRNGKLNPFNGNITDNINYEFNMIIDFQYQEYIIADITNLNNKSLTIEFDGNTAGTGKQYFRGSVTVSVVNGCLCYTDQDNKIQCVNLNSEVKMCVYPITHITIGDGIPFNVYAMITSDGTKILFDKPERTKVETKLCISSKKIDYFYIPDDVVLPTGYARVDYLTSDGEQYIKTGVIASDYPEGIQYVFRGNVTEYSYNGNMYLFGVNADESRACNPYIGVSNAEENKERRFGILSGENTARVFCTDAYPQKGTDFILDVTCSSNDLSNAFATLNGVELCGENDFKNASMPEQEIYLLSVNGNPDYKFCGRIYDFEMYTASGTKIRQMVTCIREEDGVAGMYDVLNDMFYTNVGAGEFKTNIEKNSNLYISNVVNAVLQVLPRWEGGIY